LFGNISTMLASSLATWLASIRESSRSFGPSGFPTRILKATNMLFDLSHDGESAVESKTSASHSQSLDTLAYLHHNCAHPIIHRDVKSNNILLDADFGARVADFGLAKFLQRSERRLNSMSTVVGSFGYIAPEYTYTLQVNEKSDIYSFGVVLLELLTSKQPVDPNFEEEDRDLLNWVHGLIDKQDALQEILDSRIVDCFKEEMASVLQVALLCTNSLPSNRPSMRRVLEMLRGASRPHNLTGVTQDAKQ
jgi:hypothetical protein